MKKNSFNGVATYLAHNLEIETEKKNLQSVSDVSKVMDEYITSLGKTPPKDIHKKADFIQKDFGAFVKWGKENYKTKQR